MIDSTYLTKITNYIINLPDKKYLYESKPSKTKDAKLYVHELTTTPQRFIEHVKFYIDNRTNRVVMPDVYFNDDFTVLYVMQ